MTRFREVASAPLPLLGNGHPFDSISPRRVFFLCWESFSIEFGVWRGRVRFGGAMTFSLPSVRSSREVFEVLRGEHGFSFASDGGDLVMDLPEAFGRVRTTEVRPGVDVTVFDVAFAEDFHMEMTSSESFLEVNLCLAGGGRSRVEGGDVPVRAGWGSLALGGEGVRGVMECAAGRRLLFAEVAFSPEAVSPMIEGGIGGGGDSALGEFAEGRFEGVDVRVSRTPSMAVEALRGITACPYSDAARRIYIEAKAMEILALHLAEPTEKAEPVRAPLRPDDIERVRAAKGILDGRIEDPPSLMELCRMVGLNDFKLKAGFKEVFGATAFGYLHERRMERARRHIEAGEMNVGEVALAVGYASQSCFAAAFKKRYGIRPSSLLPHRNGSRKPLAPIRGSPYPPKEHRKNTRKFKERRNT